MGGIYRTQYGFYGYKSYNKKVLISVGKNETVTLLSIKPCKCCHIVYDFTIFTENNNIIYFFELHENYLNELIPILGDYDY